MKDLNSIFVAAQLRNFAPSMEKMSLANFAAEQQEYQTKQSFYNFVLGLGGESGSIEERFVYVMENMKKTIMSRIVTSTCSITNSLRIVERNTTLDLYNQYESLL